MKKYLFLFLLVLTNLLFADNNLKNKKYKLKVNYCKTAEIKLYLKNEFDVNSEIQDSSVIIFCNTKIYDKIIKQINFFDNEKSKIKVFELRNISSNDLDNIFQKDFQDLNYSIIGDGNALVVTAKGPVLLKIKNLLNKLEIYVTKKIPIFYRNLDEVSTIIESHFNVKALNSDVVGNSLIITATKEKFKKIKNFLLSYDKEPAIILVEGVIIKLNYAKAFQLGTNYQHTYENQNYADNGLQGKSLVTNQSASLNYLPPDLLNYSIKWTSKTGRIYQASLGALIGGSAAEVLLKPHLTFLSGGEGSFSQTVNIPSVSASQNGTNIEYNSVGLVIEIGGFVIDKKKSDTTYQIVLNKLHIQDGEPGEQVSSSQGSEVAYTSTAVDIKSTQIINSGELITVGGAIQKQEKKAKAGFPILSSIPVIKYLFGYREKNIETSEMLALLKLTVLNKKRNLINEINYMDLKSREFPEKLKKKVKTMLGFDLLSSPKWSSKIIYKKNGGFYNKVNNKFSEKEMIKINNLFKKHILTRLNKIKNLDYQIIEKQIINDKDLKQQFLKILSKKITPYQVLIIARHLGSIDDVLYSFYLNYLKKNKFQTY